jgi:hypothetical protein
MRKRRSGEAPDLGELLAAINGSAPAPPPDPAAPGDEAARAGVLAAVADGSIFAPGADNLRRLAGAVAAGWLDETAEVTDATRRKILDHVGERLRAGDPAECAAARAALGAILQRPGAKVGGPGPGPSHSAADGPAAPEDDGEAADPGGSPAGGRSRRGRFLKGNKFSLGNSASRRMAALRAALGKDIGEDEMRELGKKLYGQALSGDAVAARLLLEYLVGRPRRAPDPDALDLMEWKLLSAGPTLAALWHAAHEVVDVRFAAEVWKRLSAADADAATDQLVDAVEREPGRFAKDLAAERRAKVGR